MGGFFMSKYLEKPSKVNSMVRITNKTPPIPKPKIFSLREFWGKRNQILIKRDVLAWGDFLMHRMVFEDLKKLNPELIINFACPKECLDALKDHPFIDSVLDSSKVKIEDYFAAYDTSTACTRYESALGPEATKHRSDIWANHCGFELQSHDMHLSIALQSKEWAIQTLSELRIENKPLVLFCPYSANSTKNILDDRIKDVISYLKEKNCVVFSINKNSTSLMKELNIPVFSNLNFPNLLALVDQADYVISVDTLFFHAAGGLGKPLVGIFGYIDGKIYGKYYQFELVQKHKDNGDWDCGPCGYHNYRCPKLLKLGYPCIFEITTEMLHNGVDRMLNRWPWKLEKST